MAMKSHTFIVSANKSLEYFRGIMQGALTSDIAL